MCRWPASWFFVSLVCLSSLTPCVGQQPTGTGPTAPSVSKRSPTSTMPDQRIGSDGQRGQVTSVVFSPDGKRLVTGGEDRTVRMWDVSSRRELATFDGHTAEVLTVAISPDGGTIASGSVDRTLRLWDVATSRGVGVLEGHHDMVRSVAFSPDGRRLASGSWDKTVKLWDVESRSEITTLETDRSEVKCVAFSPNGRNLASGGVNPTVEVWDLATREVILPTQRQIRHNQVLSIAYSPDGKWLATASENKKVRLWDVSTYKHPVELLGHSEKVWSVAFGPDSRTLASADERGKIWVWKISTASQNGALEEPDSDGRQAWGYWQHPGYGCRAIGGLRPYALLYSGPNRDVDAQKIETLVVATHTFQAPGRVYCLTFAPGGMKLATVGAANRGHVVHGGYGGQHEQPIPRKEQTIQGSIDLWDLNSGDGEIPKLKVPIDSQLRAVNALKALGARVVLDDHREATVIYLGSRQIKDADLRHLNELTSVRKLDLSSSNLITDAGLERLQGMTNLKELTLDGNTQITGVGLVHLKQLPQLEYLSLRRSGITDANLEHLKALSKLKYLSLYSTSITDAGVQHLKAITSLERLTIKLTGITDSGLQQLTGLPRLVWLELKFDRPGAHITLEGVNRFKQVKPNCWIDR